MPDDASSAGAPSGDVHAALRAPLTVLVCLVPLGLAGEVLRWHDHGLDSGRHDLLADPLLASLGGLIGLTLPVLPLVALVAGCLVAQVAGRHAWAPPGPATLGRIVVWAAIWAAARLLLGAAYHLAASDHLAGAAGLGICGALQEELIFRCLVLGGLVLLGGALELPAVLVYALALTISAGGFSLAHTTVLNHFPGAEPFAWPAFCERAAAGLLYGLVFLRQGLAVCTLAHVTYNLVLVMGG